MFEFKGLVNIYLEGHNALEFYSNGNGMIYYVGAPESKITVHDLRHQSCELAKRALSGRDGDAFASAFSQPAWVEVRDLDFATEITIQDYTTLAKSKVTLWLGTLNNDRMSIRSVFWEQIKFLHTNRIAFASLIND